MDFRPLFCFLLVAFRLSINISSGAIVLPTDQHVFEGASYTYNLTLSREPTAEVQLAIASSVSQCSVEPDIVAFSASNYSLGKTITYGVSLYY